MRDTAQAIFYFYNSNLFFGRVVLAECCGGLAAHVSGEDGSVSLAEIDHDQPIENVGEFAVHVEAKQLATDFRVLAKKDRQSFAVDFNVGDRLGELLEI